MEQPAHQPIDLLRYYIGYLHDRKLGVRELPAFCRIAIQLCHDLPVTSAKQLCELDRAVFSVLKQATWQRSGIYTLAGPVWLDYEMAHSYPGPFPKRNRIHLLSNSIAQNAYHYRGHLFGDHSSASSHRYGFQVAILSVCMAIERKVDSTHFTAMPRLPERCWPDANDYVDEDWDDTPPWV